MSDDLAGHRRRLIEAFGRDRRRLTRFVERKLWGDGGGEAEDIVSDVMLRLFERADLLAQVEDVTAYLYGALAHAVTDFFRRRRTRPMPMLSSDQRDGAEEAVADTGPDPELAYARWEQRERISSALSQLTAAERAVWVAVEVEGCTFRELAERWGEPIGTLLSRKSRASARLRRLLAGEEA